MKTTIKISMMDILTAVKGFDTFHWKNMAKRQDTQTVDLFDFLRAIQLVQAELIELGNKVVDEIELRTDLNR